MSALQDRARFAAETEALEAVGNVRRSYRVVGERRKERWIASEWHLEWSRDPAGAHFLANLEHHRAKASEEQRNSFDAENQPPQ